MINLLMMMMTMKNNNNNNVMVKMIVVVVYSIAVFTSLTFIRKSISFQTNITALVCVLQVRSWQ